MIKILHIGNTAGIASIIAYYMDRMMKTKSMVLQIKGNDPFKQTFYGKTTMNSRLWFNIMSFLHASRTDIIHVHASWSSMVPRLKLIFDKPIILHYHGTDIRGRWNDTLRVGQYSKADQIVVSTADLILGSPKGTICIKNPVNLELFKRSPEQPVPERKAFTISYNADDEAQEIASKWRIPLDIIPRKVPYSEMPNLMRKYTHFIEIKRDDFGRIFPTRNAPSESLTSLEARAMGLTILRFDEELRDLPEEHTPEFAVKRFYSIYQCLINREIVPKND